jgi:L-lactate dehydrogenase complex protein LldE
MIRLEYPHLFMDDPNWGPRANRLAAKTYELSEFLIGKAKWEPARQPADPAQKDGEPGNSFTYHDSCHMCRLLGLREEPRRLLSNIDISLHEMKESDHCCGFGGIFSLRMPEVSTAMTAEKLRQAAEAGAGTVITADPGCLMQMRSLAGEDGPAIRHLALILEEATR